MQLITVKIDKPDDINFRVVQTLFIKSVEDIHEALVVAVPGIWFGLAFCEAADKCLVRWSSTHQRHHERNDNRALARPEITWSGPTRGKRCHWCYKYGRQT